MVARGVALELCAVGCGKRLSLLSLFSALHTQHIHPHTHTHPATQRAQTVRFSLIERHFDEILVERTHLRHVQLNAKQKA